MVSVVVLVVLVLRMRAQGWLLGLSSIRHRPISKPSLRSLCLRMSPFIPIRLSVRLLRALTELGRIGVSMGTLMGAPLGA